MMKTDIESLYGSRVASVTSRLYRKGWGSSSVGSKKLNSDATRRRVQLTERPNHTSIDQLLSSPYTILFSFVAILIPIRNGFQTGDAGGG